MCYYNAIKKKGIYTMHISKRLKELRIENNFSQEKLAEILNVSRQTISNWENERSYPDVHNLIMLCDIYSVSLNTLMKGDIEIMKKNCRTQTRTTPPRCNTAYSERIRYDYRTTCCRNWSYCFTK